VKKRALVTGAAGFIGSHFLRYMVEQHLDWEFVLVDCLSYAGTLDRIDDILRTDRGAAPDAERTWPHRGRQIEFVFHDIRAYPSPFTRERIGKVDYVFHLAAETHVDRSTTHPDIFVETNVMGTFHLLEYCRKHQRDLEMFFLISTDEVYGAAPHGVDHTEDFPHRPSNVYSATKAAAEDIAYAYNHSMGVPVIVTNTMNNIGETQDVEKYVPKLIRAMLHGDEIVVHGSFENPGSRKYLHARDHAAAINFLISFGERGQRYNVVGIEEIDNLNMMQRVRGAFEAYCFDNNVPCLGLRWAYQDFHSARPGHDLRYSLDGMRLRTMGWVPKIRIDDAIADLIKFSMEHPQWLVA